MNAGLPLDRALGVCVENLTRPTVKATFAKLRDRVRHGASLARAMQESDGAFAPMASAMAEAGEASGRLDESLSRLAETMERAETLRQTIVSSMVYPIMLIVIATSVILMMLLFVVPQFENLFTDTGAKLPFMTQVVMGASHAVQNYGVVTSLIAVVGVFLLLRWARQPAVKRVVDRQLLKAPVRRKRDPQRRDGAFRSHAGKLARWRRAAGVCARHRATRHCQHAHVGSGR